MSDQATASPDATATDESHVLQTGQDGVHVEATAAPAVLRVLAYIADLCVVATVVAIALIVDVLADLKLGWVFLAVGAVVALLASIVMHGAWGASPGKHLAQLRVVDAETAAAPGYPKAAIRSIVFDVLSVIVYLPAWTVLADKTRFRRGLHEKVSHTLVVDATESVSSTATRSGADKTPFGAPTAESVTDAGAPSSPDDQTLQRIPTPLPGDEPSRDRLEPPILPAGAASAPRFGPPPADEADAASPVARPAGFERPVPPPQVTQPPRQAPPLPPQAPTMPPARSPLRSVSHPPAPRSSAPYSQAPQPASQPPAAYPQAPQPPLPRQAQVPPPARSTRQAPQQPPAPAAQQRTGEAYARTFSAGGAPVVLRFDDGHSLDVSGDGIIGREPVIPPGVDGAALIKHVLVDDTASVSKTHLRFGITRNELWVEDVGSTNGSAISYRDTWTELTPGERYVVEKGSVVHIGQRSFKVLG